MIWLLLSYLSQARTELCFKYSDNFQFFVMQIGPNSNNFSMLAYQNEVCEVKPTVNLASKIVHGKV